MVISKKMLQRIGTVASILTVAAVSIGGFVKAQPKHLQASKADVQMFSASNASTVASELAPDPVTNVFVDGQHIELPANGSITVPHTDGSHATVSHTAPGNGSGTTAVTSGSPTNSVSVSITTDDASKTTSSGFTNFQSNSFGQSYGSSSNFVYTTGGADITTSH